LSLRKQKAMGVGFLRGLLLVRSNKQTHHKENDIVKKKNCINKNIALAGRGEFMSLGRKHT